MRARPRQRTIAPPLGILERLAVDTHSRVAMVAAANPNCGPGTLSVLADDDEAETRYWVASNPDSDPVLLERLAEHDEAPRTPARICSHTQQTTPASWSAATSLPTPTHPRRSWDNWPETTATTS